MVQVGGRRQQDAAAQVLVARLRLRASLDRGDPPVLAQAHPHIPRPAISQQRPCAKQRPHRHPTFLPRFMIDVLCTYILHGY